MRGHRLALDDFVYRPGLEPLMELAEYVKLDVLALSEQQLFEHIELVHHYGAKLVAEKVESLEQVEDLRDLGVELFQGFALARPVSVRASAKRVNRVVVLELLAKLQDPEAEIGDQVDTIARDPDIAYALLRILNSGYFSFVSPIDSIHQAVVMLGADGLRNWVTMMVMTRLAPHAHELTSGAFIRAKMCELCAQRTRAADPAIAFSAGLFSVFPELLDMTMPVIARQLGLGPELTTAIVELRGPIGHILDCVLAYENQDQRHLADRSAPPEMINAFLDAARWSTETMAVLTTT